MGYLKRNNFFMNIFAALSFIIVIAPNGDDVLTMPWCFIAAIYLATTVPIFESAAHFIETVYSMAILFSFILLLFSGFKNRFRTIISITAGVTLLSILFSPYFILSWTDSTSLAFNSFFIVFISCSLIANIAVYKDERSELKHRRILGF